MKSISKISELDLSARYSYADYLSFKFEERLEIIKGKIFKMSPAPNLRHQRISQALNRNLLNFTSDKHCEVFAAPFDVRLPDKAKSLAADEEVWTVVQPDLCIFCDPNKLDKQGGIGAPDLVVEILSPGNTKKEMKIKYALYEESGIPEYWVVSPEVEQLHQFVLGKAGKYELHQIYVTDEVLTSPQFAGLEIPLEEVLGE